MPLLIANRQRTRKIHLRTLKEITAALLTELAEPDATLEVTLVSPAQMARVNQTHLRHEGPTDVITFDYREAGAPFDRGNPSAPGARVCDPQRVGCDAMRSSISASELLATRCGSESRAPGALHGELFICPEVAVAQAREFGTDWRAELVRYVIHGLLHLLGHDDMEPIARRKMKRVEGRLLRDMGRRFALRKL